MRGRVASFGADGWGLIEDAAGERHPFHSTAIADGSRTIDVGTAVEFALVPGRQGRWEATAVTPL